ncbi:protein tyrosine phosphatase family protein [Candidatus Kuenenia sp.]|uniref:protein tyrosine phosphatase family protein n=1 Tax=Candidatus Kuenenia sp. TaxID=2499824 RepID=UPI003220405B
MKDQVKINDSITSAGQPSEEEIKKLPQEGFKSVVNLRASGEEDQPLSPKEEGELVKKSGMKYLNIPVSVKEGIKPEQVDQFCKEIERLPAPVFVHCSKGKRAGAFAMMYLALKEGITGEQALQKAMSMGFECDAPQLKAFFIDYINQHGKA